MPVGIMLFASTGAIQLDQTGKVGRIIGTASTNKSDGSISPPVASGETLFMLPFTNIKFDSSIYYPTFTVTSTKISWNFSYSDGTSYNIPVDFLYGVY